MNKLMCLLNCSIVLTFGVVGAILVFSFKETISCQYGVSEWKYIGREVNQCIFPNLEINAKGFTIRSAQDLSVEALNIRDNKKVKFLPDNIGEKLPNLIGLQVWNCSLLSVNGKVFRNLRKLVELNLAHNQINFIPRDTFNNLPKLEYLSLASNRIDQLDSNLFIPLTNLKKFLFNDNQLRKLNKNLFRTLQRLEVINLNQNRFEAFDENLLVNLPNLRNVSFCKNQLETLPDTFFVDNQRLERIWLDENRIESLSPKLFKNKRNLKFVSLMTNECINSYYWADFFTVGHSLSNLRSDLIAKC